VPRLKKASASPLRKDKQAAYLKKRRKRHARPQERRPSGPLGRRERKKKRTDKKPVFPGVKKGRGKKG